MWHIIKSSHYYFYHIIDTRGSFQADSSLFNLQQSKKRKEKSAKKSEGPGIKTGRIEPKNNNKSDRMGKNSWRNQSATTDGIIRCV